MCAISDRLSIHRLQEGFVELGVRARANARESSSDNDDLWNLARGRMSMEGKKELIKFPRCVPLRQQSNGH